MKKISKIPIIVLAIFFLLIFIQIIYSMITADRISSKDDRRIGDLRQIPIALEMYFDDNKTLPESLSELEPKYFPTVPKEPTTNQLYEYHVIEGGKSAVIKVVLDNKNYSTLKNDIDGVVSGINCDDPAYCIIFKAEN